MRENPVQGDPTYYRSQNLAILKKQYLQAKRFFKLSDVFPLLLTGAAWVA